MTAGKNASRVTAFCGLMILLPAIASAANGAGQSITAEMTIRGLLILVLFVFLAAGIALRRIPAMVALPLMALGIGVIAGVPLMGKDGVLQTILEGSTSPAPAGAFKLYKAIIYTLFGGMFAKFISDAKIAERLVKYAAELGGEDPFFVALLMSIITIIVFSATAGLPAIIMLGTVMFPVLLSLGVPPVICGSILLMSFPIGSCLQPSGWQQSADTFGVDLPTSSRFFLIWSALQAAALLIFLIVEFLRMKRTTVTPASVIKSVTMLVVILAMLALVFAFDKILPYFSFGSKGLVERYTIIRATVWGYAQWGIIAILCFGILHCQAEYWFQKRSTLLWNLLTPLLPLLFLLGLGFESAVIPAFLASLGYGFLTTPQERGMQKLGRSIINGVADVVAPIVLMVGIGMLIAAAMHPTVSGILTPIFGKVMPSSRFGYVVFFLIASPLALYRGPLNSFGLGVGVAKLMQQFMPPAATMGALQAVGMLQDPTTTQNIWICGYLKLDINSMLFKLFFYSIGLCVAGLIFSAFMYFPG